jgi:PAS domain S-box-containing protein
VYVCDAEGRITLCNRRAVELWGREPRLNHRAEKFTGAHQTCLADGTVVPPAASPVAIALRDGRSFRDVESIVERPDGVRIVVAMNIDPLRDGDGRVNGAIVVCQDVTNRKRLEERLRAREAEFRLISDNAPVILAQCSREQRYMFVNRSYAQRFGLEPSEVIGRTIAEVLGAEAHATLQPYIERVLRGEAFEYDVELAYKDIGRRCMHVAYVPDFDPDGTVCGWLSAISDVTERHRIEEALRASEKRFRELIEVLPGAVCTCDAEWRITYYNEAAAALWGFHPAPGTRLGDVVPRAFRPDGTPIPAEQLPLAIAVREGRALSRAEIVIERQDGTRRVVLAHPVPTRDAHGVVNGGLNMLIDITEHREAEETVRRLAAIVGSSEDAIIGEDLEGNITSWNAAAERLYGYTASEAVGQPVRMLMPPERHDEEPAILDRIRRGEKVERYETVRRRRDGRILDVSLTVSPIKDAGGRIIGAAKIAHDITARRTAAEALRRSDERLRMATRAGKIGIWDWDIAANRVTWTDSLYEIHGVRPEQFDGTADGFAALVHPEDAAPVQRAIRSALEHDVPYELEFRAVRPDGRVIWLFTNAIVVRDAGRPVRMLGATFDITERKLAELNLRESEKRFRTLASHAPVGIFLTDAKGETIFVNESWCRMSGLTLDQARGGGWLKAVHPDDRERIMAGWQEALARGGASDAEYRFVCADGSVTWVQGLAVQMRDANGRLAGYIGTISDFTLRKNAEERLRESEAQLQAHAVELERKVAERTASLREAIVQMEEFSYSVSHDLRAPLRAMNGYAEALVEDYGAQLDATARGYLERIQRSSQRMEKLTHDLLTYSRVARSEVQLSAVDVKALLRDLVSQYEELQPRAADLEIAAPLHPVRAHESSLGQCLANLLTNAAKFVAPGVRPRIRVRCESTGERVRIWIEDNGIGIDPKFQSNLFRAFERVPTREAYAGTGIGLAVVRKAMEKMGGRCGVESDGRNGSRFWIEVPSAHSGAAGQVTSNK